MNKLLVILFSLLLISFYTSANWNAVDLHHILGRCSGSNAYCSACKNCSGCKHCADYGGSCAVCYTPRATSRVNKSASKSPSKSRYNRYDSEKSYLRKITNRPASGTKRIPSSERYVTKSEQNQHLSNSVEDTFTADVSIPKSSENSSIPEISENDEFIIITAQMANLRKAASTKSGIIGTLNHNELLIKLQSLKGWVKVKTLESGEVGYVAKGLVE